MKQLFYIKWENEYSKIEVFNSLDPPSSKSLIYAGPFKSLNEAKKTLIPFLETKISDTRENLQEIRALRPEDFGEVAVHVSTKEVEDL